MVFAVSTRTLPFSRTESFAVSSSSCRSVKLNGRPSGSQCRRVVRAAAETATSEKTPVKEEKAAPAAPSFSKGAVVRVDKEKYLNSVEYLAVDHPKYFSGLDYIYENRGEILDLRKFEAGEFALIGWAGIPTAPAWLPTSMLIKAAKLEYKRT